MSTAAHTTKSPRQLYTIAKTLGVWDPAKIDLTEDKAHWQMLNPEQREQLIKTCALFYEGEVSVSDTWRGSCWPCLILIGACFFPPRFLKK